MGYQEDDYLAADPNAHITSREETYRQDFVLVLRYPGDELVSTLQPGTCLVSMLHYPTRPGRVELLKKSGIEAISLDSVKDDVGRRRVENLRRWPGTGSRL
jgi:alanine dehydrogenase